MQVLVAVLLLAVTRTPAQPHTRIPDFVVFLSLLWFSAAGLAPLVLLAASLPELWRHLHRHSIGSLPQFYSGLEPPITVLVPAHDEAESIVARVQALLNLLYAEHEVLVLVCGAEEETAARLLDEFALIPMEPDYECRLHGAPRAVYRSTIHANLRVLDLETEPGSAALNAGLDAARFPYFCVVTRGMLLRHDTLHRLVQPMLEAPGVVVSASVIGVADGCEVVNGFVQRVAAPRSPLALLQVVASLRTALFPALTWTRANALWVREETLLLCERRSVMETGGIPVRPRGGDVGPLLEVLPQLHRDFRQRGMKYRIVCVGEPVCWRESPRGIGAVVADATRAQTALRASLPPHVGMLLRKRFGAVGALALPHAVFELLSPLPEIALPVLLCAGGLAGAIAPSVLFAPLLVMVGCELLASATAIVLAAVTLHLYRRPRQVGMLFAASLLGPLGWRQLRAVGRLIGLFRG